MFVCEQETAYERRISYWSSDECSSVLGGEGLGSAGSREHRGGHVDGIAYQVAIFDKHQPLVDILGLERHGRCLCEFGAMRAGIAEIFDQLHLRLRVDRKSVV